MTHHAELDSEHNHSMKSCLGESLRRLQSNLNTVRRTRELDEDQFHFWLKGWSKRSNQITTRLEMIDRQLEKIIRHSPATPNLSLITESDDC